MTTLTESWKSLRQALTHAASAEVTQRARTALTRDLPAWLLELGTLAPVALHTVSADLADELAQVACVCAGERKYLRGRGACRPLALKLSLDRVSGALAPLDAALARTTLALRRSDPRLAAIGAASLASAPTARPGNAAPQPAPGSVLAASTAIGPLAALPAQTCRAQARTLRAILNEAARAARSIQRALRATATGQRDASRSALAGAIEQTRTLAAWLRQQCDGAACQLAPRAL
ncbi:MAG TPA: hypothetical protein VIG30_08095 [Ktedonobacterales bacterium]|jgi:hypothetical protein